ncbi:MAG: hypothetical protein PHD81_03625 [Candidatus Nanoarchaeia archaeon]|nr:hypothetical protein [Candidatus Nanoarchaeia archaeon]MDD5588173.1 hypothetical protein [Candidatus Nanoarchaeia archaeon]
MVNIDVIEEKPLSMAEVKEKLANDKELTPRGTKTLEYLKATSLIKSNKAEELKEKLKNLDIQRLKDKHIIKIIDILPKEMDSLKVILSQDVTLKQEDLQKILELVNSYS